RDAFAAARAIFSSKLGRQFPAVREGRGIQAPTHFLALHGMSRRRRFCNKPSRNDLPIFPAPTAEHAVSDSRELTRRQTRSLSGRPANLFPAVEKLKPPMLDPERLEQGIDGVLVVGFSGHSFTDQRGMVQR